VRAAADAFFAVPQYENIEEAPDDETEKSRNERRHVMKV
jgi:hypothetical protein